MRAIFISILIFLLSPGYKIHAQTESFRTFVEGIVEVAPGAAET
jgi:hypothetical protein